MKPMIDAPAWNIDSEYPGFHSKRFHADEAEAEEKLRHLEREISSLSLSVESSDLGTVERIQSILVTHERVQILLSNLTTYLYCVVSVEATNSEARAKLSQLEVMISKVDQALAPLQLFLQRCSQGIFDRILERAELKGYRFLFQKERELAPFLLSDQEEVLLKALTVAGHKSWGTLYDELTGKAKVHLKFSDRTETLGLAEAAGILYGPDQERRKAAWHAIQDFWTEHRETAAGIVNALAAWRIEVCRKRSRQKKMHFLDTPLFMNRVSLETIEAIFECCKRNLPELRKAPALMAKVLRKDRLDPWDLLGPSPVAAGESTRSFAEGSAMVRDAFHQIHPQLSQFVEMMVEKRWIEGRVLPNKSGGAYCTGFAKSLEPRVFQTYYGSLPDITTLAHELGHAFHSWVMRDLPRGEQNYPATLAETASVFGETALRDALFSRAKSKEEQIEFAWSDVESIAGYLINIPVRFTFEKAFYEKREKAFVSADELCSLMDQTWTEWYGPTLTKNDTLFWASKGHFSIADLSFYNFPYSFGYLFSLSIYARKEQYGAGFMEMYVNLLRDTGRMTAEEVVNKHLGEDLKNPKFWQQAMNVEIAKIHRFERLIQDL